MGMTDTLLQFQILICTSTFTSLKRSIFSVSFSATRVSKGQATLTMKHNLPSFSRTTISVLLLLLLLLLLLSLFNFIYLLLFFKQLKETFEF